MRDARLALGLVLLAAAKVRPGGEAEIRASTYVSGYEVVKSFPHDPKRFTQGLAFSPDGRLWESDGLYRESLVREVDAETGKSLSEFANPTNIFGEGLVVHGNKLVQLSWKEDTIHELSLPDLKLLRREKIKIGKEGWGLASDGKTFYVTDSGTDLYHVEPDTYKVLRKLPIIDPQLGQGGGARVHGVNELEMVGGELWGNVLPLYQGKASECVVRLNATSGRVLGWVDLRGLLDQQRPEVQRARRSYVLNGLAYHEPSRRLYVTGKKWDKMFQIRIVPKPDEGPSDILRNCQLGLSSATTVETPRASTKPSSIISRG